MKLFARFILHWLEFDLARAMAAPVRNSENIAWLHSKIDEWELVELQSTRRLT